AGDELTVHYTARANADASRLSLHRGAAGVSGVGHGFVVRPALGATLPLVVRFHAARLGSDAVLATSLDGRTEASVEDLAAAVYVAGAAHTEALPSGDRATAAFGTAIEGRDAAGLAAKVRALSARAFGLDESEPHAPLALFVIGEHGIGKENRSEEHTSEL